MLFCGHYSAISHRRVKGSALACDVTIDTLKLCFARSVARQLWWPSILVPIFSHHAIQVGPNH